ncbi:TIGR04222 domain-containing membrane protein [Actinokineospora soli]|uniref:TIGR04222 domain-containing membrane protein n=1 Tax=Actinokineospora soli TaxID=1048753 RepID=A0ABW2TM45_9PSEU
METAVARLLDLGKLRASRNGAVRVVAGATATDAVDRAVLTDAERYANRTISLLVDRVGRDDAVQAVRTSLVVKGLLVDGGAMRARLAAVPALVLLVVGIARWVNGVAQGYPVGWLSLGLVVTAVVAVLLYRAPISNRTYAGERLLKEARGAGRSGVGTEAALLGGATVAVLFGGLAAYPDPEVSTALAVARHGGFGSSSSSGARITPARAGVVVLEQQRVVVFERQQLRGWRRLRWRRQLIRRAGA